LRLVSRNQPPPTYNNGFDFAGGHQFIELRAPYADAFAKRLDTKGQP
jgi:hypothetical protein